MRYVIKGQEYDVPTLRLYLVEEDGAIYLKGDDDDGDDWYLLEISDNKIRTMASVNTDATGFEVNINGEIEIYCEEE